MSFRELENQDVRPRHAPLGLSSVMRNPLMLTLTKESGEALTLMKGDEVVELLEESADPMLFFQTWNLHFFPK